MIPQAGRQSRASRHPCTPFLGWLVKGFLIAGLLASMLFAHGCHGNDDLELLAAAADRIAAMK